MSAIYRARTRRFVPPVAPKTRKAEATRTRVLGVACELFVELGFAAVSMRDIADQAGMTHGGLYGHFRSKGQLLVEVLRWRFTERGKSPEFVATINDPARSVGLLTDRASRDIRLLQIDAAAAARHDPDVASGMLELYAQRHQEIRDLIADDVPDSDTVAFIISVLEAGIGAKESIGAHVDADRVIPAIHTMLWTLAEVDPARHQTASPPQPCDP